MSATSIVAAPTGEITTSNARKKHKILVLPPAPAGIDNLPDVNLQTFLKLAAKFNLYTVSLDEVKMRVMRRLSAAVNMPKAVMDPLQLNLRIEGPWPLQAFQTMLKGWALLANSVQQGGTARWMWYLSEAQPMPLGKTFSLSDHPSGNFLGKLFRPKTAQAARALTFMFPPAFVVLVDRPDGSQHLWFRCNLSTLSEHGSMGYTRPKRLPRLVQPRDPRWEEAYLAMRWGGVWGGGSGLNAQDSLFDPEHLSKR